MVKKVSSTLSQATGRYAIVSTHWNAFIVEHLEKGAINTLVHHGIDEKHILLVQCPGALELPLTVQQVAKTQNVDAIIAVGAIIRGDTPHFDYVSSGCIQGLTQISLSCDLPVLFGVLTADTTDQVIQRAGLKSGNKGAEAALAALEMVDLLKRLKRA